MKNYKQNKTLHGIAAKSSAPHERQRCVPDMAQNLRGGSPRVRYSRAEGKEKGKGVIVRWGLKEAQSKNAVRRTGTGYEV